MPTWMLYSAGGAVLFLLGLHGLFNHANRFRKVLAMNIASNGVLLIIVASALRAPFLPDPVPHAMVLTGVVVAVSTTAVALALVRRIEADPGEQGSGANAVGGEAAPP